MSECAQARPVLAKYCELPCLELGFGGVATVPEAVTFDMPIPYCPSFEGHPQILQGDCKSLPFICDNAFSSIISHHLLEDFYYPELVDILKEWRRLLKPGGLLITNCPNQAKFKAHILISKQGDNLAHREASFSLETFKSEVVQKTGSWEVVFEDPDVPPYSFYIVLRKIA